MVKFQTQKRTVCCIVGVGITSETRSLLFSSVQPQKHGVILLTYVQPQKQVIVWLTYLQPQRHAVVLLAYQQSQTVVLFTYLQPRRHALSCSSFKKIAFSFRTVKEEGLPMLFTQVAVARLHSFWSLQRDMCAPNLSGESS